MSVTHFARSVRSAAERYKEQRDFLRWWQWRRKAEKNTSLTLQFSSASSIIRLSESVLNGSETKCLEEAFARISSRRRKYYTLINDKPMEHESMHCKQQLLPEPLQRISTQSTFSFPVHSVQWIYQKTHPNF